MPHNIHKRRQQINIAQPVALTVRHQLAESDHTSFSTTFQFVYSAASSSGLQYSHAVNAFWEAAHRINHVTIGFLDQARIGPAKGKSYRDIHARGIHLCN